MSRDARNKALVQRIAALEAENAALKEEVKEQDEREAKWAKRFDQQIGHFAVRLYNVRKRCILIARRRISALRNENAALKERWEKALSEAREAAGHEFGLWPLGAAAITHQLRQDKARLVEALEEIADGDGCNCRYGPGCDMKCKDIARAGLHSTKGKL